MKQNFKPVKAWAIIDHQKSTCRLCYANKKGSYEHKIGAVAIYFKKPRISYHPWIQFKSVIPVLISPLSPKKTAPCGKDWEKCKCRKGIPKPRRNPKSTKRT